MSKQPNKRNKWIVLINIPIQMGIVIFLFAYLGMWLDEKYPDSGIAYVKILTMVGVFIALYNVIRQVKQLNDD
ncbi:MAG: AtpZ/AtpI family protein [Flavobacteriales bacterium]|nr:AtpZ/AtpI family protein [Flavobacteriales bacterium]